MTEATLHGRRPSLRDGANKEAWRRRTGADPVLRDVQLASEVVPGMRRNLMLTSGAPLAWPYHVGGQREAIIGGALFEALTV